MYSRTQWVSLNGHSNLSSFSDSPVCVRPDNLNNTILCYILTGEFWEMALIGEDNTFFQCHSPAVSGVSGLPVYIAERCRTESSTVQSTSWAWTWIRTQVTPAVLLYHRFLKPIRIPLEKGQFTPAAGIWSDMPSRLNAWHVQPKTNPGMIIGWLFSRDLHIGQS